jgi:hypothetical protein
MGAATGWALPALQLRHPPSLAASEWVAIAAAPLAGAALVQLIPFPNDIVEPLAHLTPWLGPQAGGVTLAGHF